MCVCVGRGVCGRLRRGRERESWDCLLSYGNVCSKIVAPSHEHQSGGPNPGGLRRAAAPHSEAGEDLWRRSRRKSEAAEPLASHPEVLYHQRLHWQDEERRISWEETFQVPQPPGRAGSSSDLASFIVRSVVNM